MTAAVRVKIVSIAPAIIKLINKTQGKRANDLHRKGRKEVPPVQCIRDVRPYYISPYVNQDNPDGRYNQVT